MSRFPLVLRLLVSATLMVVSTPATAQYIEQIDVSIANVDVVVTDRDGKPVRGLTKDDFTLYENGNVQPITNFTAFDQTRTKAVDAPAPSPSAEPPAAAPDRARLVVLFIDIDEIEPVPRKRFFEGVGHYLETAMRPGDFLTLLHWSNRVRVVLPPTSNQKVVAEAVKVLAESNRWSEADIMRRTADAIVEASRLDAAFAGSLGQTGPDPDAESRFQEWFTAEERCARIKRKIREIRSLIVSLARVDLQKVLLFASDDVSLRPTQDCSTMHQLDDLANTANAYGLTIHAFHPPGVRDRNVLSPELTGSFSGGGGSPMADEYERVFDQAGGLLHLAHRTGGRVGVGPGESADVLQRAASELETYYSLGYRLSPGKDDKPRKIKVVTKDRTHRVRTRDTVMRLSEATRLRDRVSTNLYLPDQVTSASLTFTPKIVQMRRDGKTMLADVALSIPAKSLLMLRDGQQKLRGSFSVLVAAGRELGDTSEVTELKQDFDSKSAPADGSVINYSFTVRMRPDSRRLSIALRDNLSGEVATKLVMLEK